MPHIGIHVLKIFLITLMRTTLAAGKKLVLVLNGGNDYGI
jgi:hypothetical protein